MEHELIARLEHQLARWDVRIDQLESELEQGGPKRKYHFFREVQALKEQRDAAHSRLHRLKSQNAKAVSDLQPGLVRVFMSIGHRVERLASEVAQPN